MEMKDLMHTRTAPQSVFQIQMRALRFLMLLGFSLLVFFSLVDQARAQLGSLESVTPKAQSRIQTNVIRLSDIFEGIDESRDRTLGRAPLPGEKTVIGIGTLMRLSQAYGLGWQPQDGLEKVVVRRAGKVLDSEDISPAIRQALKREGIDGHYRVVFDNPSFKIAVGEDHSGRPAVHRVDFDAVRGRFDATLRIPDLNGNGRMRPVALSGAIERQIRIPVVRERMKNGQVIRSGDVEWITIPEDRLPRDAVIQKDELIGMTPRRNLTPMQPVRGDEVHLPLVVSRGDIVTILLESKHMRLTAEGKALEDGARGTTIRVVNKTSSRVLEGVVKDSKLVQVQTPAALR